MMCETEWSILMCLKNTLFRTCSKSDSLSILFWKDTIFFCEIDIFSRYFRNLSDNIFLISNQILQFRLRAHRHIEIKSIFEIILIQIKFSSTPFLAYIYLEKLCVFLEIIWCWLYIYYYTKSSWISKKIIQQNWNILWVIFIFWRVF